jgi:hypothetical protein
MIPLIDARTLRMLFVISAQLRSTRLTVMDSAHRPPKIVERSGGYGVMESFDLVPSRPRWALALVTAGSQGPEISNYREDLV